MEKELEKSGKKKRRKQPKPAQPGRAAARPRRLTGGPRLSAAIFPRARPPSLARCPVGPACRRQFSSPRAPSLSVSRARSASRRAIAPRTPFFSLCAVGLPCQFRPLHVRCGPARAHSRTSQDFSATTPAHTPSSLLRAPPVPHAHPSPHFAQLRPLSRSAHVTPGFKEQSQVHLIHAPKKTTYIITECIEINVIKHQSIYYIAEDLLQSKIINIKRTKDRRRQCRPRHAT
jgi:hypothetical protein